MILGVKPEAFLGNKWEFPEFKNMVEIGVEWNWNSGRKSPEYVRKATISLKEVGQFFNMWTSIRQFSGPGAGLRGPIPIY